MGLGLLDFEKVFRIEKGVKISLMTRIEYSL